MDALHTSAIVIDAEIDPALRSFVGGGGVTVDSTTGKAVLTRILLWYSRDFGFGKGRQMRWALDHVEAVERERLARAAVDSGVVYGEYDWRFA